MDAGTLTLFIKLVGADYQLSQDEITRLTSRMLADDKEFEKVWELYKTKAKKTVKGVDNFESMLKELLS